MGRIENISIENAKLTFRNFAGKATQFNPTEGDRTFAVIITDSDFADSLKEEGWNVKQFKKGENEDVEPDHFLKVKVSYKVAPPHIWLCGKRGKHLLTEETIASLDYADIASVDVIISPYRYTVRGETGVSAYVKTMYVNVVEDEFADKYRYDDAADEMPWN